jgi:deoxyribodipyrimidine photo-lyase
MSSSPSSPDRPAANAVAGVVWFRDDLRLADNPALLAALAGSERIACVYVHDTNPTIRPMGAAARWWLHQALTALDASLRKLGGELLICKGDTAALVPALVEKLDARAITWNRRYGAAEQVIDAALKARFLADGRAATSHNGALLYEPWQVKSQTGTPMRVFTPFWRAALASADPQPPQAAPKTIPFLALPADLPGRCTLADLKLLPTKPDWSAGMAAEWTPGEAGAAKRLETFLTGGIKGYAEDRNRPDKLSTSRLSPHLRFGEISPRQIWQATEMAQAEGVTPGSDYDVTKFLTEVGWREFSHHLLHQFPKLANENFQPRFDAFPWRSNHTDLKAWQKGMTGYPIVDAGMRELWQTGWMHNRVRMVVASFLVKHLMIDWRQGEEWFWDTLVDADAANNSASWQWVAGSGADAAPYFRIFAPVLQGEKFDPNGDYVRRYVPEIAKLPNKLIHKPWLATPGELAAAGVKPGTTYPLPIVDHDAARKRALSAFASLSA